MKERNASLLRAMGTARPNPSSSTVFVPGTGDEYVATVLVNGKSYKVDLTPSSENSVEGKLPTPVAGRMAAVVALNVDGKSVSARFTGVT